MSLNRLQKIISESGLLSRRKVDLLIKQGRVTLNGRQPILGVKKVNLKTLLKLTRKEGRNRQIRKIATLLGHPVQDLQRISISNINSNGLQEGKWRELKPEEWISILN